MGMNLFRPRRVVVVAQPLLTDSQLERALVVEDTLPLWMAIQQLIEASVLEASEGAELYVSNPALSASCNGGADHLKRLRDKLYALREKGIEQHKRDSYGRPEAA